MSVENVGVKEVGIHAIEVYFPRNVVDQKDLEKVDGVSTGKYTIGLGQKEMSVCGDQEDVVSLALTVTRNLLEKYEIEIGSIGFLAFGTETIIDKSKSVKTELMRLFEDHQNIEGVDVKNACFGGAQAVFHAVDWVRANHDVDGRMAMAVMADIAVYEEGPARCTGGAGAVAILIGPNAPIVFEHGHRAFYMTHGWDFYKPITPNVTEYPLLDGQQSQRAYMNALEMCYKTLQQKVEAQFREDLSLDDFHAAFFHCPYTKLVKKSVARLHYFDLLKRRERGEPIMNALNGLSPAALEGRDVGQVLMDAAAYQWSVLTEPFLTINTRTGNMYTPSLFVQLVSWLAKCDPELQEKARILMFAFGSGSASAMFTLRVTKDGKRLNKLREVSKAALVRLDQRNLLTAERYKEVMKLREELLHAETPVVPFCLREQNIDIKLFPGTYYLQFIDGLYRRYYQRTAPNVVPAIAQDME